MQEKKHSDFIISGLRKKKVAHEQFGCSDAKSIFTSYLENGRVSLNGKSFFREASCSQNCYTLQYLTISNDLF